MKSLAARFVEVAERQPDHAAVVDGGSIVTYGELLQRARSFAALLREHGVTRGGRVAVFIEKSADTVAALLGTQWLGAICVPIDPATPGPRLELMLRDCEAAAFLSRHAACPPTLAPQPASPPLSDLPAAERVPLTNIDPVELVNILYTSGSTGKPKGVAISLRATAAFVDWAAEYTDLQPGDRVSSHSAFAFDLSIFDIYSSLMRGATIVLVPELQRGMAPFLAHFIERQAITVWYSVPSIVSRMAEICTRDGRRMASVRHLIVAGEAFRGNALPAIRKTFPNARIHNFYGPTETNVVTWYEVPPSAPAEGAVPIGHACPYASLFVRDGVLYAGGATLMSGYWRDPERTRAALVEEGGETFYCTNDSVQADESGTLTYVGRTDSMVKIGGYRVEPGEIETVLSGMDGVRDVAVVPFTTGADTALAAFVVGEVSTTDLAAHCRRRLPAYMTPAAWIALDAMPRNDRGKIDRAALQSPLESRDRFWKSAHLGRDKYVRLLLPRSRSIEGLCYLLHSYGGNFKSWSERTPLAFLAARLPIAFVMPESGRRWFIDDESGRKYGSYLIEELLPAVESELGLSLTPGRRLIGGFSMGGAAAVFHALRRPDLFGGAFAHAGAFHAARRVGDPYAAERASRDILMPDTEAHEAVWGPVGSRTRAEYDPQSVVERFVASGQAAPRLYLDVGTDDYRRVVEMVRDFHRTLGNFGIPHEYREMRGAHTWDYVSAALPASLAFLGHCLGEGDAVGTMAAAALR
ncbi:MAG TPA: AMP-binding protein [Thermoanaerobaculia bacterium]|nr:AMP-binding protein [Thermoanaerobaculia bacterium]